MIYKTLFALLPLAASGLRTIPERARGGSFFKELQQDLKASDAISWGVYPSKLDNFKENSTTFNQRYAVDSTYWDGKGPIFYEIGGEGTLRGPPDGYIATLAQNYSALLIALEHRYLIFCLYTRIINCLPLSSDFMESLFLITI
jgi:hypothetical protein